MTPISSNATNCFHNPELTNTEENHFNLFFSKNYIGKETFDRLNLITTFNELKYLSLKGDSNSFDILFNLSNRRDELGKYASHILIEIKDQSEINSYERECFNNLCDTFYQQCRLNEESNGSPQLFQLPTALLTYMLEIQLKRNNDTNNQNIFNLIQLLQIKSAINENHFVRLSDATSATMAEEDELISIFDPKHISSFDNPYKKILTVPGSIDNHIMDNKIAQINESTLSPYLSFCEQHQIQESLFFSLCDTQTEPLSQTRHEFIEFLEKIRESNPFSDRMMEKLIHKWDFNNPIFIAKPDLNTHEKPMKAITSSHWQIEHQSSSLRDKILKDVVMKIPVPMTLKAHTPSMIQTTNDEKPLTSEENKSKTSQSNSPSTTAISRKISTWFFSFLK